MVCYLHEINTVITMTIINNHPSEKFPYDMSNSFPNWHVIEAYQSLHDKLSLQK